MKREKSTPYMYMYNMFVSEDADSYVNYMLSD